MSNLVADPFSAYLVGLWDFNSGSETQDTGLADGVAQNGHTEGGAFVSNGQLHTNGHCQWFDVSGNDDAFDLGTGTIAVQFTQDCHVGTSPDTIVNRGEAADWASEGFFNISVTEDGRVKVIHCSNGEDLMLSTQAGFFNEGDLIEVVYSWDEASGATFSVQNKTQNTDTVITSDITGLTMDIGDNDDENFTFGARESDDGTYDQFFDGKIDYVAVYDIDVTNPPVTLDGYVEGDNSANVIDANYTGDPDGDKIDNGDAILPGEAAQDDVVLAGGGNDFVLAGAGNDEVYGGDGNDTLCGQDGDDVLFGEAGADVLEGMNDNDALFGGAGNDRVYGDAGSDTASGGVGDDLVRGGSGNDTLSGSKGDDTVQGGSGDDLIQGGAGADTLSGGIGNDTIFGGSDDISQTLGFEDLSAGDLVNGQYLAEGVTITSDDPRTPVMVFDSANPTGGDSDLATGNLGNVLILSEDRDGSDPDDNASGGTFIINFESPATVHSLGLLDVEEGAWVKLYDDAGNQIAQRDVFTADNGQATADFGGVTGVCRMEVILGGSGAIDNLSYSIDGNSGDEGDVIDGGDGDDALFGNDGNDTLDGGAGADQISGGDDNDLIFGGAGDVVDGGAGGSDYDILDLTGQGPFYVTNVTPDSNGNGTNGTIVFVDGDGNPTGDTLTFTEIEEIRGNNVGQPPVAVDDTATTDEDTPVTIDVLGNDTDPDGDPLEVINATSPNGDVTINPDGTITFTPNPDFNGDAEITYTVTDPDGNESTATVSVTVVAVNDAPEANDDADTTAEDTPITVDLLANDFDVDGDALTVVSASVPANQGTLVDNGDGTVTFTPAPNFNGEATISYTIEDEEGLTDSAVHVITVTPANDAPEAEDDTASTTAGTPVVVDVLGNDSDPDGDPLTVISATSPDGDVTINPDGTITFTPNPGFEGVAQIDYTVEDPGGLTDSAVVDVKVRDGIVSGTDGSDLIDADYMGDPGMDLVDAGDEILPGEGPNDDIIQAGDEDDTILAGLGNDEVFAGEGDDQVHGGPGDDEIFGEGGNDDINGGAGNDTVDGGIGNDTIDTGDGRDSVLGGDGADLITTSDDIGPGIDLGKIDQSYPGVIDGEGDPDDDPSLVLDDIDFVDGGAGDDTIRTGDDADTIFGGIGNDLLDGGIDDDEINGGAGDDVIIGGEGDDLIDAGAGNDTVYAGNDPALGLDIFNLPDDGSDPTFGPDLVPNNGIDTVFGGDGNDVIFGADDADILFGDAGDDFIDGEVDNDLIDGGSGNDTLLGGQGDDTITGGSGNDTIDGGIGNDNLSGGDDRDLFINVNANDVVDGDAGGDDYDILDLTGSAPDGGSLSVTINGPDSNGNGFDGFVTYFDEDGNETGTLNFTEIEEIVPCFTPGTMIATPRGEVRVEELQVGDRVITRDNGIQEIRWIGQKALKGSELVRAPHLRPVLIRQGALGNGLPERDMMVSPNHRVLVANDKTALYFEESEVLVAAKHLTGLEGVDIVDVSWTTYIHVMFEQHEVILSDGAWTESFQPGDQTLGAMGNAQRNEIFELFPELQTVDGINAYTAARRSLKKHEAQLLTK